MKAKVWIMDVRGSILRLVTVYFVTSFFRARRTLRHCCLDLDRDRIL